METQRKKILRAFASPWFFRLSLWLAPILFLIVFFFHPLARIIALALIRPPSHRKILRPFSPSLASLFIKRFLHHSYFRPRSTVRRPLFPLQFSRQAIAPCPDRGTVHASHSGSRCRLQLVIGYSWFISKSFFFLLFPLSTFYFSISRNPNCHPDSACVLQYHHRHPHRRQRSLTP